MQAPPPAAAPPPPVVVTGPGGQFPASICAGVPEVAQNGLRYCILGFRLVGDDSDLRKASVTLNTEGWKATLTQLSATMLVVGVDAKGKSASAIQTIVERARRGDLGKVKVEVAAIPYPGQTQR